MGRSRPITGDDILLTELLIAQSYGNLKQSVIRIPAESISSLGGHLRRYPFAAAGAAVGAGILLFGLWRLLPRSGGRAGEGGRSSQKPSMSDEIVSLLLPVLMPLVMAFIKEYIGRRFPDGKG